MTIRKFISATIGFAFVVVNCAFLFSTTVLAVDVAKNVAMTKSGEVQLPDGATYKGGFKNGLFEGSGKLTWTNGRVYQGGFKNGLMHGSGKMTFASGHVYQGEMQNGLMSGAGKFTYNNGDEYIGNFLKDDFSGQGELLTRRGAKYTGQFAKGEFNGSGRYLATSGDIYQGNFKQGDASGASKIEYSNGDIYIGNLVKWKMHGQGEYRDKAGITYSGQFIDDAMLGEGEVKFKSGGFYKGYIKGWRANGVGEMFSKGIKIYTGEFKNGIYDGQGKLIYKSGNIYEGRFEKGLRHGMGIFTRKETKGRKKVVTGWWQYGDYVGSKKPSEKVKRKKLKPVDAEAIFYSQHELLSNTLSRLKFETPFEPDLYMLAFGSAGYQDVFMNEVQFSTHYFDMKLGTFNRSIGLINNHKVAAKIPMATVTNLETSLNYIARLMDKKQDILFLFLTSHGSKNHELSVSLRGLPLNDLPAKKLASIIKKTGIKWKVIVVSACYSGGFIKYLKDDFTMIMTAAKSDHVSFGCSDEADFTYFGRALFKEAIPRTSTFRLAFERAKEIVTVMEKKEDYSHSQPQFYTTDKIEAQLKLWRKTFKTPKKY